MIRTPTYSTPAPPRSAPSPRRRGGRCPRPRRRCRRRWGPRRGRSGRGGAEAAWALDTAWVAGHAFTVWLGLAGAGAGPLDGLGSSSVRDPGSGLVPWSQSLIEQRTAAADYCGPADAAGLRDAAWRVVRGLDAATAERFFLAYEGVADDWLEQVGAKARSTGPVSFGPGGLGGLG